jgi:hypothetical protein
VIGLVSLVLAIATIVLAWRIGRSVQRCEAWKYKRGEQPARFWTAISYELGIVAVLAYALFAAMRPHL